MMLPRFVPWGWGRFGEQIAAEVAAEGPDCHEIHLEDEAPVVVGELVGWMPFLDAGAG